MATSFDKLRKYFNIGYKKSTQRNVDKLFALKNDPKKADMLYKKGEIPAKIREVFPSNVQLLMDWWMSDTHQSAETWKTMQSLYKDCDLMFMNSGIMSRAAEITADEVVQADINTQPIIVEAKSKQKKFILDFFDRINIYNYIRSIALSIVKYGNAGMVLSYDNNGIDAVIPINVKLLKERLEFSPYKVREMINGKNNFLYDYKSKVQRIDQLIQMIDNKDNVSSYYKDYLFGFVVGDYVLPPWRFLHFRNHNSESPFDPFGVPLFIYSIAPYLQLDAGLTMQVAARGASFPKDIYKINLPANMPPSEKLSSAVEFARELQNSGINAVVKEKDGVGEVIITINDLYEYEQHSPDIDLGRIGDLEMLRDDLILSTLLPRYILDPNDGSFGDSGVALVEKWKPFARIVYGIQSSILEQINQLVKIEMINSGEFSLDEMDFILKMPYPESQTNDDIIRSQNDLLDLANNVIGALSDKFMDGEQIPTQVMKDIYKKFLPYDDKLIDEWIKKTEKASIDTTDTTEENEDVKKLDEKWLKIEKKVGKIKLKENINEYIFFQKQNLLREGAMGGYHYYSSKNKMTKFPAEFLIEFKKKNTNSKKNKLNENNEELGIKQKYKFRK